MSCYICSKDTLTKVLKSWCSCSCISIKNNLELQASWEKIIDANIQAYYDRYKDDDVEKYYNSLKEKLPFTLEEWTFNEVRRLTNVEKYDALEEYVYQCAEGDYHNRPGYYMSKWCLNNMLDEYIEKERNNE